MCNNLGPGHSQTLQGVSFQLERWQESCLSTLPVGRIEGQIVKLIGSAFIGFVASYIIGVALPPLVLAVITIAAVSLIFHRNPGQFRGA